MTNPMTSTAIGVVLCNLGTPATASEMAVRSWLAEMLSDRRIVNLPPALWQPILRGIILCRRPAPVAEKYASIWDHTRDASPLLALTHCLTDEVRRRLFVATRTANPAPRLVVADAMRYGAPSIAAVLDALEAQGCNQFLCVPLYPQYSFSTSASVMDGVRQWQKAHRQTPPPEVRSLPAWYKDAGYISALADSVEKAFAKQEHPPALLLVSFHGLPEKSVRQGDPYRQHCEKTFALLKREIQARGFAGAIKTFFSI